MKDSLHTFNVSGMSCANCALGIKVQLEKKGYSGVIVNFSDAEVSFLSDSEERTEQGIKTIESLGYRVQRDTKPLKESFFMRYDVQFAIALFFTLPLMVSMFLSWHVFHNPFFQLALTLPVYTIGVLRFGRSALMSLKSGIANMDLLIITGATAAFIYSLTGTILALGPMYMFYETSAGIITIVLLGNLLEHRAVKKTTSAIDELVRLQPAKANRIIRPGTTLERIEHIDVSEVKTGELLQVNEGDKVPVDGIIESGTAVIDESLMSGESIPITKHQGDTVVAGSIVSGGSIRIRCTAIGSDTALAQIIELVKEARNAKPRLQNLADRISAVFVPTVIIITIITFLISYFVAGIELREALLRSIAVLVIACPCALGLAIPTAVVVGVGKLARRGILIKGAISIEKLALTRYMVFDKTGTLTTGQFSIKNINSNGIGEEEAKTLLLGLEKHSSHPLARSLTSILGKEHLMTLTFNEVSEIKGVGVKGVHPDGKVYMAGSYDIARHLTSDDSHNIYLLAEDKLIATVDMADTIKPGVSGLISYLKKAGIVPVMLSGDRKGRCEEVASQVGITQVYSEKLPAGKIEVIRMLRKKGTLAMVGDGINDAPALAEADIGISLSNATEIAMQSAQVILLNGDIALLETAVSYSKRILRAIKQNLFWAFFYNVLAIPVAAAGYLTPLIAAFSMAASDVIVVLNSLRLKLMR